MITNHKSSPNPFKVKKHAKETKAKKRTLPRIWGVEGSGRPSPPTHHPVTSKRNPAPVPVPQRSRSRGRRISLWMMMIPRWMISPCWKQVQPSLPTSPLPVSCVQGLRLYNANMSICNTASRRVRLIFYFFCCFFFFFIVPCFCVMDVSALGEDVILRNVNIEIVKKKSSDLKRY